MFSTWNALGSEIRICIGKIEEWSANGYLSDELEKAKTYIVIHDEEGNQFLDLHQAQSFAQADPATSAELDKRNKTLVSQEPQRLTFHDVN